MTLYLIYSNVRTSDSEATIFYKYFFISFIVHLQTAKELAKLGAKIVLWDINKQNLDLTSKDERQELVYLTFNIIVDIVFARKKLQSHFLKKVLIKNLLVEEIKSGGGEA